jgi:hypothetical protein
MAAVSPDVSQEQSRGNGLERAVAFACRIVARNEVTIVRSARVVGGRRLTGAELIRLHSTANEQGLRLTMDGSGTVMVRRVPRSSGGVAVECDGKIETIEGESCR